MRAPDKNVRAWLYDGKGNDEETSLAAVKNLKLPGNQLLWIDASSSDPADLAEVVDKLGLDPKAIARLLALEAPLQLDNYGDHFSLSIVSIVKEAKALMTVKPTRVVFLVSKSWIVSIHDGPVEFIEEFRDQDKGDTNIGLLTPALLLSALLDWHLSAFLVQVSHIESEADRLDESILRGLESRALVAKMVKLRKRISSLRRMLSDQRSAIYGLSRPDILLLAGPESQGQMDQIAARFDRAIDEIERSRDVIIGSFELFTSLTGQKTNELVKGLTYVTVVIGLCGAIAGLLGMNFDVPFFKSGATGFAIVVSGLAVMIVASFAWAKWRKWF